MLIINPTKDSLNESKAQLSKASPTDVLYIEAYSADEKTGKLRDILDTILHHLNSNYEKKGFWYDLLWLFSSQVF